MNLRAHVRVFLAKMAEHVGHCMIKMTWYVTARTEGMELIVRKVMTWTLYLVIIRSSATVWLLEHCFRDLQNAMDGSEISHSVINALL